MIKLVILGSSAALPSKDHSPTCFAVKHGGVYLFDASEGVQQRMMRYGVSMMQVKAIFLSHLHADHFLGIPGLIQTMNLQGRTDEMLIVGPTGTRQFFETLFSTRVLAPQGYKIKFKEVARAGKVFKNDLFEVKAFSVEHSAKALGFALQTHSYRRFDEKKAREAGIRGHLFTFIQEKGVAQVGENVVKYEDVTYLQKGKTIVYSGDTLPCKAVEKHAKECDLLIHEATFMEAEGAVAREKRHSTAGQAAAIARKADAKRLLLLHVSNRYEDRGGMLAEAKGVFANSEVGREGMEILI
ncbi:ribonuclease Z [Candidatus Micrarchaeota archaeon]|nr:ribonuclease Z [Candidatus Micrarchaeota archaeon]MBI5176849.1 ribonuclease Z [Candidatus Micrarchaeota archaeon]